VWDAPYKVENWWDVFFSMYKQPTSTETPTDLVETPTEQPALVYPVSELLIFSEVIFWELSERVRILGELQGLAKAAQTYSLSELLRSLEVILE